MPYIPGSGRISDVYHSDNVFANFIPVALWNDANGPEAAVMAQILGPNFLSDGGTITVDGEEDPNIVVRHQQALVDAGIIKQSDLNKGNDPTVGSSDSSTPQITTATFTTSTVDTSQTSFPDSYRLSTNYTLGAITKAPGVVFTHPVAPSAGLSIGQVVENLQFLTQNCIEPVKAHRPDMFLTNTFRPSGIGSPTSQHPKGMACDMQFSRAKKPDYFTIAQWIRDNVSYDQLLLEYKTTGSKLPWIHLSFNKAGNRGQVMTFMNDKKYSNGLVDLSGT